MALDLASAGATRLPAGSPAGGLAAQSVNGFQGIRLPPSRLRAPVSPRDCRGPIAPQTAVGARYEPS